MEFGRKHWNFLCLALQDVDWKRLQEQARKAHALLESFQKQLDFLDVELLVTSSIRCLKSGDFRIRLPPPRDYPWYGKEDHACLTFANNQLVLECSCETLHNPAEEFFFPKHKEQNTRDISMNVKEFEHSLDLIRQWIANLPAY